MSSEFKKEMGRFLSADQINKILNQDNLWDFVTYLVDDLFKQIQAYRERTTSGKPQEIKRS